MKRYKVRNKAVGVSLFPFLAGDAELLRDMMANFPEDLLMAFGMNGTDLSTVLGYYSFVFLFVQICLAIQASNYGFALVSIEERELTADFLLTKPVRRNRILTIKYLAAFTVGDQLLWGAAEPVRQMLTIALDYLESQ
jgi:ABC-2 type transport system permease protein